MAVDRDDGRASAAERSLLTLKRAGFKLALFVVMAGAQALGGHGFVRPLAMMALLTSLICALIAALRQERATAPYWTTLDEAAWFFLLGFALRRCV